MNLGAIGELHLKSVPGEFAREIAGAGKLPLPSVGNRRAVGAERWYCRVDSGRKSELDAVDVKLQSDIMVVVVDK